MAPGKTTATLGILLWLSTPVSALALGAGPTAGDQNRFDVTSFGAKGDGITLNTQAIQSAIRAANKAGGGAVIFPPGVYVSGTFTLLSNVSLDVEAGAVLQGSKNLADYGSTAEFGFGQTYSVDSTGEGFKVGLIVARDAENISIVGRGVIDGNGDAFFDPQKIHYLPDFDAKYTRQGQKFMDAILDLHDGPIQFLPEGRPGTTIVFDHCKNVLLRDITLRNAPNWGIHLGHTERAVVEGIHILNSMLLPNDDGIDCISCRDVHISDSDIHAGDDDFAIVGSENVSIANCTLVSNSAGIRLDDTRYSLFTNLSIHSNRGIGIFDRGGGHTAFVQFSNIVIETHLLTGHWWGKAEPIYIAVGDDDGKPAGSVHDLKFSEISGEAENGIVLYGNPGAWIRDISLDHVHFHFRVTRPEVNAAVGGNFDLRGTYQGLNNGVFAHNIPGLYARYIRGLAIRDLEMQWADAMPGYYTSAVVLEDFENLSIDGFIGRQASIHSDDPVIALSRGRGVSILNSRAQEGASTFLAASEVTGEGLFEGNDLLNVKRIFSSNAHFTLAANLLPAQEGNPPMNVQPAAKRSKQ
jgi:parallel beta-helix repeat protein